MYTHIFKGFEGVKSFEKRVMEFEKLGLGWKILILDN